MTVYSSIQYYRPLASVRPLGVAVAWDHVCHHVGVPPCRFGLRVGQREEAENVKIRARS